MEARVFNNLHNSLKIVLHNTIECEILEEDTK